MFTYLDGVETNLAFLILKTTSRFRETERTLVLKIQLLMNPTLSEKRRQNYQIIVWWLLNRQLRLLYSILWYYSDECIHANRPKNAERNKLRRRFEFVLGWRLMMQRWAHCGFKTFIIEFWQYGVFPLMQVHSTTVFFKISVRRTKYWLKISKARERLNISWFPVLSQIFENFRSL